MATQTIVQSLAYISWALLLVLALGSFSLAHLLRQVTDVTAGYVGFTASTAAALALLAWLTDGGLPYPDHLDIHAAPDLDGGRGMALAAFTVLAVLSAVRYYRGHRARWLGPLAILAGVTAMTLGAVGWASGDQMGLPLLVELLSLAAVSGGSLAAVILAHWYLVTPRLSERPLILTTQFLLVALGVELLLYLVWQTVSTPDGRPFSTFTGPEALFVWLQLIVGLIFPLVLTYMAYRTALTRSMESATGLIYIELAAVLASTIVVAGLAFAVGLLGDRAMNVTVRLFALQRQQTGWRERQLALPEGATIADAWRRLVVEHPVLEPGSSSVRFARNAVYADAADILRDGDELAVIPPVAGGGERYRRIELSETPLDEALLIQLRAVVPTAADGALVLFVGQTRDSPGTPAPGQEAEAARFAGQRVESLGYEAFPPMALAVLESIADEIEERFGVRRLAIVHRVGEVPLADASVVIAAAAGHRGAAFDACRYAIEELKGRAPIWKSERFAGGSVWLVLLPAPGPPDVPEGEGERR